MNSDLVSFISLVLWSVCLLIGLIGQYVTVQSSPVMKAEIPTQATLVDVSLNAAPSLPAPSQQSIDNPEPDIAPLPVLAPIPAVKMLAMPVPTAFRAVTKASAAPAVATRQQPAAVFRQITFGSGEGNQPRPDYPIEAQLDGQEGTIEVSFVVDTDGHIASTSVTHPCRWPLLNQAAERSIRDTWSYPPGSKRYLKVSITYRQKP